MTCPHHAFISATHWGSTGAAGADKVKASVLCVERDTVIGHQTDIAIYHTLDFKGTRGGDPVS